MHVLRIVILIFSFILTSKSWAGYGIMEALSTASAFGGGERCSAVDKKKVAVGLLKAEGTCLASQRNRAGMETKPYSDILGFLADKNEDNFFKVLALEKVPELKCAAARANKLGEDRNEIKNIITKLHKMEQLQNFISSIAQICGPTQAWINELKDPRIKDRCQRKVNALNLLQALKASIPFNNLPRVQEIIRKIQYPPLDTSAHKFVDKPFNPNTTNIKNAKELEDDLVRAYRNAGSELEYAAYSYKKTADEEGGAGFSRPQRRALIEDKVLVEDVVRRSGNNSEVKKFTCQIDQRYGEGAELLDRNIAVASLLLSEEGALLKLGGGFAAKIIGGVASARTTGLIIESSAALLEVAAPIVESLEWYSIANNSCFGANWNKGIDVKGRQCRNNPTAEETKSNECLLNSIIAQSLKKAPELKFITDKSKEALSKLHGEK